MPLRNRLVLLLSLLSLCALYVHPVYDPDFWWHLKTGEWIWQNRSIPTHDPFSHTTYINITPEQEHLVKRILAQYRISQPIIYATWHLAGSTGIILLRTGILLATVMSIFLWLKRRKVDFGISISLTLLAGIHLSDFTGERPQLFSFLCAAIYLIELEAACKGKKRTIFTLPTISILWANLHGAGLFAWLFGGFYILRAAQMLIRDKGERKAAVTALLAIIISLICTFFNPNNVFSTLMSFIGILGTKHTNMNTEYMSPVTQFSVMGALYPSYWLLVFFSLLLILMRKLPIFHSLIVLAVMSLSLYAARFTPLFVVTAPILIGGESLAIAAKDNFRKIISFLLISTTLLTATYTIYESREELFRLGLNTDHYPSAAISHIKAHHISGKMFNFFEWGGYLLWHLPEQKTFIDSRVLRLDVWDTYYHTVFTPAPDWKDTMLRYEINFILLPAVSPGTGEPLGIVYLLIDDPQWQAVHADDLSFIFTKKTTADQAISRKELIDKIIFSLKKWAEADPQNPLRWARLANAYYRNNDRRNALVSYKEAYRLKPNDPYLANMVVLLER
ncbi:MAG: hypothetical protein HZA17_10995 [Nitrospirae bacterium]|nr:hypothetical protein [Nitrospirota bacterium]